MRYAEEEDGFVLPERYRPSDEKPHRSPYGRNGQEGQSESVGRENGDLNRDSSQTLGNPDVDAEGDGDGQDQGESPGVMKDSIIVTWYGDDDPANPQCWCVLDL